MHAVKGVKYTNSNFELCKVSPKSKLACPDPPYLCTALFGEGLGNVEIFASIIKLWSIYSRRLVHNLLVWAGACSLFLETFRVSTEFHTIIYTIPQNIIFLKFHDNIKHNHSHTHFVKLTIKNNNYVVRHIETQEERFHHQEWLLH